MTNSIVKQVCFKVHLQRRKRAKEEIIELKGNLTVQWIVAVARTGGGYCAMEVIAETGTWARSISRAILVVHIYYPLSYYLFSLLVYSSFHFFAWCKHQISSSLYLVANFWANKCPLYSLFEIYWMSSIYTALVLKLTKCSRTFPLYPVEPHWIYWDNRNNQTFPEWLWMGQNELLLVSGLWMVHPIVKHVTVEW